MTDRHKDEAPAVRRTKGSVQEAIGKLIGDDAAQERGAAERRTGDDANAPSRKRP